MTKREHLTLFVTRTAIVIEVAFTCSILTSSLRISSSLKLKVLTTFSLSPASFFAHTVRVYSVSSLIPGRVIVSFSLVIVPFSYSTPPSSTHVQWSSAVFAEGITSTDALVSSEERVTSPTSTDGIVGVSGVDSEQPTPSIASKANAKCPSFCFIVDKFYLLSKLRNSKMNNHQEPRMGSPRALYKPRHPLTLHQVLSTP